MHDQSWSMGWGMSWGMWLIPAGIILIVIFLIFKRRK